MPSTLTCCPRLASAVADRDLRVARLGGPRSLRGCEVLRRDRRPSEIPFRHAGAPSRHDPQHPGAGQYTCSPPGRPVAAGQRVERELAPRADPTSGNRPPGRPSRSLRACCRRRRRKLPSLSRRRDSSSLAVRGRSRPVGQHCPATRHFSAGMPCVCDVMLKSWRAPATDTTATARHTAGASTHGDAQT